LKGGDQKNAPKHAGRFLDFGGYVHCASEAMGLAGQSILVSALIRPQAGAAVA